VNIPVPGPSVVLEPVITGFAVVAQQVPLAVTAPPPSDVIFPPAVAVVKVIAVALVVVSVGATIAAVVNEISFP
jgi:hypothetical protein